MFFSGSKSMYFAEYLPRLESVYIQIDLPRGKIEDIKLDDDKIIINHDVVVNLPKTIDSANTAFVVNEDKDHPELSNIRLQSKTPMVFPNESSHSLSDNYKWNLQWFKTLDKPSSKFSCSTCHSQILDLAEITHLMPMPSELWYEMLDFWHCHKPKSTKNDDLNIGLLKKFNELKPKTSNLIVGSYYFLVNENEIKRSTIVKDDLIFCSNCHEKIGEIDINYNCLKLFKWKLALKTDTKQDFFMPFNYVSYKLIEEMDYSAVKTFNIKCNKKVLQVWCFGLNINISISGVEFVNCLKIMYKLSDEEKKDYGFIEIDYDETFEDFVVLLNEINELLPENLQKYKDWNVSYVPI